MTPSAPIASLCGLAIVLGALCVATHAQALSSPVGVRAHAARRADAPRASTPASRVSAPTAPSAPPLASQPTAGTSGEEGDGSSPLAASEADPLVSNGLGSPLCKGALGEARLSFLSQRNCETSGFVAAASPTGNFGLDVHIDTGLLGLSSGGLLTVVQDLFVTPVWMAVVWVTHALVVLLEWCFTIDLLDSAGVGDRIALGLRHTQAAITVPWLATALAVGSVIVAYNGIVRRRVSDTLGQTLVAMTMMTGGFWVMLDPSGTVGVVGSWANQASLGALAVTSEGSPARGGEALGNSFGAVFAAVIEAPWCYLEFGDVNWCRDPARVDPRLRAAASRLSDAELGTVGCKVDSALVSPCVQPDSPQAARAEHSARLLREARSNGAIFLALPANGPQRNSINDPSSLLRAICQSEDATACRGPGAAEAEFRTNHGTWSRVGGLLLILAGVLGMFLLLGYLAIRLLASAVLSLLYLMLAPVVVLAPLLGETGRAAFRMWAARLLSAVVSKLLFSFLLGVLLTVVDVLAGLDGIGWWAQWMLMSVFWWSVYLRRHHAVAFAGGVLARESPARSVTRPNLDRMFERPRRMVGAARRISHGRAQRMDEGTRDRSVRNVAARGAAVVRERRHAARPSTSAGGPPAVPDVAAIERRLSTMRSQLERVSDAHVRADESGDRRRSLLLAARLQRVRDEIERDEMLLAVARSPASRGDPPEVVRVGGERREVDARAPARARAGSFEPVVFPADEREYRGLAGLAGYGRREYERLNVRDKRAARVEIDRELAARAKLSTRPPARATVRRRDPPSSSIPRRARPDSPREPGLEVMHDIREVAARRKRQLGLGKP